MLIGSLVEILIKLVNNSIFSVE